MTVALYTAGAFVLPWFFLGPIPGAVLGVVLYAVVIGLVRPAPLRESWRYLHALA